MFRLFLEKITARSAWVDEHRKTLSKLLNGVAPQAITQIWSSNNPPIVYLLDPSLSKRTISQRKNDIFHIRIPPDLDMDSLEHEWNHIQNFLLHGVEGTEPKDKSVRELLRYLCDDAEVDAMARQYAEKYKRKHKHFDFELLKKLAGETESGSGLNNYLILLNFKDDSLFKALVGEGVPERVAGKMVDNGRSKAKKFIVKIQQEIGI